MYRAVFNSGVLVACLASAGCGDRPEAWNDTDWWDSYRSVPEWSTEAISGGGGDQTTRPFGSVERLAVDPGGKLAVVQGGIPAAWIYDRLGRSMGPIGRSEIMELRGPGRSRNWAERPGWFHDGRFWIVERGGGVAVFSAGWAFSDFWEPEVEGERLGAGSAGGELFALIATPPNASRRALLRVTRGGRIDTLFEGSMELVAACPDAHCFVLLTADGGAGGGYRASRIDAVTGEQIFSYDLPAAPAAAFPDDSTAAPIPLGSMFVDSEGHTWLGLSTDDRGSAYWLILGPSGVPRGRVRIEEDREVVLAVNAEIWAIRRGDGVSFLHRYSLVTDSG